MTEKDPQPVPDPAARRPENIGLRLSAPILPIQNREAQRAAEASRENRMLVVAILALLLPFGFVLAAWPLVSGRGRAWKLAVISIPFNIVGWIIIVIAMFFRMPNC